MHEEIRFRTEAGFSFPAEYQIEDHEAKFRLALAIFGFSCASAVSLGLWVAGLV